MSHEARDDTPLRRFLRQHGIPAARVEREAEISRQHFARLRLGRSEPTRKMMIRVLAALRRITQRDVRIEEIFDLDPSRPENLTEE